jgi:hypothetical protein
MEGSGQHHTPAFLFLGKSFYYALNWRMVGRRVGLGGLQKTEISYDCRKSNHDSLVAQPIV